VDDNSFISSVVDLFREILYDILGLFAPGAALLLVLSYSPFESVRALVGPLTRYDTGIRIALFIGASYVIGYAIQGFAGYFWGRVMVRAIAFFKRNRKKLPEPESPPAQPDDYSPPEQVTRDDSLGIDGISPAFRQVKADLEKSELIQALRQQIAAYCSIESPDKLSLNEIEHMCYAIAGDRADDAFAFSFRADLSNGMFLVSTIAFIQSLLAFSNLSGKFWLLSLFVYAVLAIGFALRAWTYFNIRGRIIYSIGLAAISDEQSKKAEK
jgi:hypothetical protein